MSDARPFAVTYLGDEASAAAFALAGIAARAPAPGEEREAFERACAESSMVLLGAKCALGLPPATLESALASLTPLVAIVRDGSEAASVPDAALRARRQLGLQA
jgi:hypothetical protein